MSRQPSEEVVLSVRDLIRKLTNFEDQGEVFNHCEKHMLSQFVRADSMSFVNRKEIESAVEGLAEKFEFHGFRPEAEQLRVCYSTFVPKDLPKPQLDDKLNMVKFLICLSESPTKHFLENPVRKSPAREEESIDWSAYLKEGIEQWSPPAASSSDGGSDESSDGHEDETPECTSFHSLITAPKVTVLNEDSSVKYEDLRQELKQSVQNGWWLDGNVREIPESTNVDARIALHWDDYVEYASYGLLTDKPTILTEYKVMREVIWQFFGTHSSKCFKYDRDTFLVQDNITISSVRPAAFKSFASEFLPYFNIVQFFRDFKKSVWDNSNMLHPAGIYFTYYMGLQQIIDPFFKELVRLEDEVRAQKTTMTLLKMSMRLREIFRDVAILKRIHDEVVIDDKSNSPLKCATTLLARLRYGLINEATSLREFNIYLTLYVTSLVRYLQIINWWFYNDWLVDCHDEFVIANKNPTDRSTDLSKTYVPIRNESICFCDGNNNDSNFEIIDDHLQFVTRQLDDFSANDNILRIITTKVLQIGKNIRHLNMMHNLPLLNSHPNKDMPRITLYHDFPTRLLARLSRYYKVDTQDTNSRGASGTTKQTLYKFPAMCPDYVKYPTDMDKLENLVDTSDGFLMKAFESFFTEKPKDDEEEDETTLFEKISKITTKLCPISQILDEVFLEIFNERYSNSGYVVCDLFFKEHRIEEHFELLRYLYLFKDGVITPWYTRLFQQMDKDTYIDSDVWQTSHLRDILMDMFPELYQYCIVRASDMWNLYRDPVKLCSVMSIEYFIKGPVAMIIRREQMEMYNHTFQFILQVKWALHTLNHMYFDEIEPDVRVSKQHTAVTILLRRLKAYRFWLINEFIAIQHYILGYVCAIELSKFQANLKNVCNLDTLISLHNSFINDVRTSLVQFGEYNHNSYGFNYLLHLVKKLRLMWSDLKSIDDRELVKFEKSYKICHNSLDTIMYPKCI